MLQNQLSLITINLRQNQLEKASQRLSSTIQTNSQNSFLYMNKGIINFQLKKYSEAQEDFQKSAQLQPLEYTGYYNRFVASYKQKQYKKALQFLNLSVCVLYINQAILQRSVEFLLKFQNFCTFNIQNQQIQISLKRQLGQKISNLNEDQIRLELKQKIEQFKSLLRLFQYANLYEKISFSNNERSQLILKKQIVIVNFKQKLQILSELKQKICQIPKQKVIEQKFQQNLEDYIQANSSQIKKQKNQNILHLQSQIKNIQTQNFSPKTKEINQDDSFNLKQMSLNLRKKNPSQQADYSQNNISSASYKKNKGKKKQELYPIVKKNQQVQIKIVMGQLTNNKQLIGSMDPYCVIQYNGQSKKTSVIKQGGLNPRWNQAFKFKLSQNISQLSIKVYDRERFKFKDDFIGQARYVVEKNGFIKLPIYEKEISAGFIFISIDAK